MSSAILQLTVEQDSDFSKELTLSYDGLDVDTSLYEFEGNIVTGVVSSTFTITKGTSLINLSLTALETKALDIGKGSYDVTMEEISTGARTRLFSGSIIIDKEV